MPPLRVARSNFMAVSLSHCLCLISIVIYHFPPHYCSFHNYFCNDRVFLLPPLLQQNIEELQTTIVSFVSATALVIRIKLRL